MPGGTAHLTDCVRGIIATVRKGFSKCRRFSDAMFHTERPKNVREAKVTSNGQKRSRSRSYPVDSTWEEMYGDFYYYYPHKFVNNVLQCKV